MLPLSKDGITLFQSTLSMRRATSFFRRVSGIL